MLSECALVLSGSVRAWPPAVLWPGSACNHSSPHSLPFHTYSYELFLPFTGKPSRITLLWPCYKSPSGNPLSPSKLLSLMSSEIELSTISPDTPLLYDRILDSTGPLSDHVMSKSSVVIESPSFTIEPQGVESPSSAVSTKWKLRNGLFPCSDCDIEDEWGHAMYHVNVSGIFRLDLELIDQSTGRTSATLKQRWGFWPKFDIYMGTDETKYATMQMNASFIGVKATISFVDGSPDLAFRSSSFGKKSNIYRGDIVVASNMRSWCTHEYEIAAGENLALFHAIFLAFDKMLIATRRKGFCL